MTDLSSSDADLTHTEPLLDESVHEEVLSESDDELFDDLSQHSGPEDAVSRGKCYIFLLFCCGMGGSLCYIATLSSLVYFKTAYGANSYVYLNMAVYFPLVPVALAQARYDQEYDKEIGSYKAFFSRGLIGFTVSIISVSLVPFTQDLMGLIVCTTFLGASGAVLQGTFNQMASIVSDDPVPKAAVSAGLQSSAFLVLAVSLATDFGSSERSTGLKAFFFAIAAFQAMLLSSFVVLMYRSRRVSRAMLRRDTSIMVPLVDVDDDGEPIEQVVEMDYRNIWKRTSLCCVTLVLTLVPSFLVGSWFTHVKSNNVAFPQILFYTRILSDFFGRPVTIFFQPRNVKHLCILSLLRLILVAIFFLNASTYYFPRREVLSITLVALIASSSGYLVTGCFQLAPSLLPLDQREGAVSKQASLLNIAFSLAAFIGTSASLVLSLIGL